MPPINRILFFYHGKFSQINFFVREGLKEQFPSAEIRYVNIEEILKRRPWVIIANLIVAFRHFGIEMLRRRRDLDDSFFSTKYIFKYVKRMVLKIHHEWGADFSFQTQSIFDCSAPGTPHFVYTDHTYESCKEYPSYSRYIWSPIRPDWIIELERSIYWNAKCVFTMSRNVENTLIQRYKLPEDKVLCVYAGCNAAQGNLERIPLASERYRSKKILFIGRVWERKGGPELVKAFRKVRQIHQDSILVIVGCNPKTEEENVDVIGNVSLDKVPEYLAKASIFCLPTQLEPFGIVFLEAMAAGLPVVGLRLGAAPDFIIENQTGVLVDPGDIAGLADSLIQLLDSPQKCLYLGENGRRLVEERYSWERTCATMAHHIRINLELDRKLSG
jgi:glycosyltransferase involved in cell wall biosynthesis